jgi:tripartite-type tricarboxylate transporter receptor subunit TctC
MKIIKILALMLLTLTAHAWEPTKPITVLIGQAPGAGNEVSFRAVSAIIEKQNPKINFIILNKPGADGNVAANMLTDALPDGYTISVPSLQGQFVTAEFWHKEVIKYNPLEWELVTVIAKSPLCLVARSNSAVNTVPDFLNTIKNPNRNINIAVGGGAHKVAHNYVMEKVKGDNSKVQTVMYKGPLQAVTGVAAGDTEFGIMPIAIARPLVEAGKVKLIALYSEQQMAGIPKTALMKDSVPGANVYAGWVISLPKGTPKDVIDWYVTNFSNAIQSAEAKRFFDENLMFTDPNELGPKGTRQSINKLREQWIPIVKNMKAE